MHIGIVGAGTAGLCAASLLAEQGHTVTLYERAAEPSAVGAGLLIQPTGQRVLQALGLWERLAEQGHRIDGLRGVLPSGRELMHLRYDELPGGHFALGLHRGVLFQALWDRARKAGVSVHTGMPVSQIQDRVLTTPHGQEGPFDWVVVADGARSSLRSQVAQVQRDRRYRWGALWFVGKSWAEAPRRELFQVFGGTKTLLGLLPTGQGPKGDELVSLFWGVRLDRLDDLRGRGLSAVLDDIRRCVPTAGPLVNQITEGDQLIAAAYRDVRTRPSHQPQTIVLGDAAHAMSPQLGQGANLALCDGWALARAIELHPRDPTAALQRFHQARRAHVAFYSWASRWLMPVFQSDVPGLGWARDLGVPWFNRVGWLRRQSLLSMAGLKTGLLSQASVAALVQEPAGPATRD